MFKPKFTMKDDSFRQLLKDLRIKKGLSQRELARRIKVPQSYVSKYETGERRLDFVETVYVCEALGVSIEEFARRFSETVAQSRQRKGG